MKSINDVLSKSIFDMVHDPAILFLPGRKPLANAAYDKFFPNWQELYSFGQVMEEEIRAYWSGFIENVDEAIDQVNRVRETRKRQELLWCFKDGTKLEFKTTIVEFPDGNIGELWLSRDVTALYDAIKKAKDANFAKTMFISTISHEIRTPMNAIIGMTSLARKTTDLERINYYLEKTEDAGHRLMSLINDVLDLSKIESGKLEISKEEFDYEKMMKFVIGVNTEKAAEKEIEIHITYSPPIKRLVLGDELRISQVILNFLSNAVKFTPENGKITVKTEIFDDKRLEVSCADTGIGISEEAQERLFESFEQADNTIAKHYGGTGLGLAICKQIVELMGGEISVESALGVGSTFAFNIPIELSGEINQTAPKNAPENTNTDLKFTGKRILLADDVEINRMIVTALLENAECTIDEAENGEEAVDLAQKNDYDLILMDVSMPVMDGLAATRKIRTFNTDVPIIAMTAYAFKEDAEACIAAGMNGHIAKPIEPEAFLEMLSQRLNNTNQE